MARKARQVTVDKQTEELLQEMAGSRTLPAGYVQRARMVLGCISGESIKAIAERLSTSEPTVIRWKNRFLNHGINGLHDLGRSGRPAIYGEDFKRLVLEKLEESPPDGYGQWDGALLAQELGVSKDAVWRLLREQRISLSRRRTWCISTDPEFVSKAADVVGLYLGPPAKAIVLCIDEKPNIQALERLTGYAVSSDRKLIQGMESTYKRNGTLNLFAALEVATGQIHSRVTESGEKTKKGFLSFMDDILAELSPTSEYHVIMDNHSIHKNHGLWLAKHPNVSFHYTPTSASWMNMVEIWFGILTRKSLRGHSFPSKDDLRRHIEDFVSAYNQNAKPFIWRKRDVRGSQLSNNLHNFCN